MKPGWNANTWNPWEEDSESEDPEVIEDLYLPWEELYANQPLLQ